MGLDSLLSIWSTEEFRQKISFHREKMRAILESPFEVKTSEIFGRYLVAKRNLPGGTLLFAEAPLFVYSEFDDTVLDDSKSCCVSCYQPVEIKAIVKCSKCKWHFCSLECSEDPCHRNGECDILRRNRIYPSKISIPGLYFLRFEILKEKQRTKWEEVMSLDSKAEGRNLECNEPMLDHIFSVQRFLKRCDIHVSLKYITNVINRFRVNAFGFHGEEGRYYGCIYKMCSLFANSCCPNSECHPLRERKEQGTMGILSRCDIAAGEMVTISYIEDSLYLGGRRRQAFILERFHFVCACTRCLDPSELSTFYSAIKCSRCPDGWFLPPTSFSGINESRCNTCNYSLTSGEVEQIEFNFQRKMAAGLNHKKIWQKKQKCKFLDNLISDATRLYRLHPNHHLVIGSIQRWLALQNFKVLLGSTEESRILYEKIIERLELLLAVMNRFGKISARVELDATIARTMIWYHFKSKNLLKIKKDVGNPLEKIRIITKILKHLLTAVPLASHTFLDDDTAATISSMSGIYDVWEKRLLRCEEDMRFKMAFFTN